MLSVYNKREELAKDIDNSLNYLKRIQNLNETVSEHDPLRIIEDFAKATAYLKEYKKFKELAMQDVQSFKNTFTAHLSQGIPVNSIDVEEEIKILKEKFDKLNYGLDKRGNVDDKLLKPSKEFPQDEIKRVKQIRKLYLPRWMSKTVAEYDVDAKEPVWEVSE